MRTFATQNKTQRALSIDNDMKKIINEKKKEKKKNV